MGTGDLGHMEGTRLGCRGEEEAGSQYGRRGRV